MVIYQGSERFPFLGNYFTRYPSNVIHLKHYIEEKLFGYRTWPKDLKWSDETFYWQWEDFSMGTHCEGHTHVRLPVGTIQLELVS